MYLQIPLSPPQESSMVSTEFGITQSIPTVILSCLDPAWLNQPTPHCLNRSTGLLTVNGGSSRRWVWLSDVIQHSYWPRICYSNDTEPADYIYRLIFCVCASNEALSFIEAFHMLLGDLALFPTALIGLHFQVLGVSPLDTHFAIILLFFMATIILRIAYMEIKLQPQDAGYLPILRFICMVSGIIAIELLFAIIISPFWLFVVNLCPILILGVLRHLYQQIYHCVYYTTNLVLNTICSLFKKVCELVD